MGLSLVTAPVVEPVSLDEIKDHLRIFDASEDELVTNYGIAARQALESPLWPGLGVAFVTQTWDLWLDTFPLSASEIIEIPRPPLQAVVSVTYYDTNNNATVITLPDSRFIVDTTATLGPGTEPARLCAPNGWPAGTLRAVNSVAIRFRAGFGDDGTFVPVPLKIAVMMQSGLFYENRETTLVDIAGLDRLVGLYRVGGVS